MQFIVTTHSPLVCRAVEKGGSIWRLPSPGTNQNLYKIEGDELNSLIYGNVLDAFGTEMFGENVLRSETGNLKLQRLAKLNMKKLRKTITNEENEELKQLQNIFPSNSNLAENVTGI